MAARVRDVVGIVPQLQAHLQGQILRPHGGVRGVQQRNALHEVFELAHVARPVVPGQQLHGSGRKLKVGPMIMMAEEPQEVLGQRGHVVAALAQRRQGDGDDVEPVEQIGAKTPGADHVGQGAVGGGHDARAEAQVLLPAEALEGALLQHAQEVHLVGQGNLAHFVEEERAVRRELEAAFLQARGPGEGSGLVAEELVGEKLAGEHAAIHRHKGPPAAVAERVQQPGENLLARAGFAGEQHRGVASGDLDGHAVQGAHGLGPEEQSGLVHGCAGLGVCLQHLRQYFAAVCARIHHGIFLRTFMKSHVWRGFPGGVSPCAALVDQPLLRGKAPSERHWEPGTRSEAAKIGRPAGPCRISGKFLPFTCFRMASQACKISMLALGPLLDN